MRNRMRENLARLEAMLLQVAEALGEELLPHVVFVGGVVSNAIP